jgi:hypothetical protein
MSPLLPSGLAGKHQATLKKIAQHENFLQFAVGEQMS